MGPLFWFYVKQSQFVESRKHAHLQNPVGRRGPRNLCVRSDLFLRNRAI